jgi:hypothetical protein
MAAMNDYVMTGATADELWPLVRDFHYSCKMPSAIRHCFAVRKPGGLFGDTGEVIAGTIYGNPCNRNWNQSAVELLRLVRRDDADLTLSQALGWSLRWLRSNTKAPFALSYADTNEGHHGGVYQATNWRYIGERTEACPAFILPDGSKKHSRQVNRELGSRSVSFVASVRPDWVPVEGKPKHLYIYPLNWKWKRIQAEYGWQALPYPKPDWQS